MAKGEGRGPKGWDATTQTRAGSQTQTLIPDLRRQSGEAYQVQQRVDVPTDGGKTPLSSTESLGGKGGRRGGESETAQQGRSRNTAARLSRRDGGVGTETQSPTAVVHSTYTADLWDGMVGSIKGPGCGWPTTCR